MIQRMAIIVTATNAFFPADVMKTYGKGVWEYLNAISDEDYFYFQM